MDAGALLRYSGLLLAALALVGCTGSMYRTKVAEARPCTPTFEGALPPDRLGPCGEHIAEVASEEGFHYTLYFAEFDDQGWAQLPEGAQQLPMYAILDALRNKLHGDKSARPQHPCVEPGVASVHLLVFVHGWKHNAKADDGNVQSFRRLTRELAEAECKGGASKREVVGLYIGWRGKPWEVGEPLISASFWDRKSVAADVAQGSVRELFATLDAIVDTANRDRKKGPRKPVRMMMVGHSFGGHILLTALGGSVVKNLSTFYEGGVDHPACDSKDDRDITRDGDMIVLVNPAIEASRYHPIHGVAMRWRHRCYRAPLFVSVTSETDIATKVAFRAGRLVSTLFESYSTDRQRYADRSTFGHNADYLTHELRLAGEPDVPAVAPVEACKDWVSRPLVPRIMAEYWNQCHFAKQAVRAWDPSKPRAFCGGAVMYPMKDRQDWRAPVLNIRTSQSLIEDHVQIYSQQFVSFLRELYMDTLIQSFEHPLLKNGECAKPPGLPGGPGK